MRNLTAIAVFAFLLLCGGPSFSEEGPIPIFDARFSPPLSEVSSLNSGSKLLAVQVAPGSSAPARVVSIDKRGRVGTLIELSGVKELKVPSSKLWIAGEPDGPDKTMPVTGVLVYLSGGGETFTVVYKAGGVYYELRHYDRDGRLLFIAAPRDAYGLKAVHVSRDGSRVVVVDESPMTGGVSGVLGQRVYFYARDGRLLAEHDYGDDLDLWLEASAGLTASDGGYFIAARGRGKRPGSSLALFDGNGRIKWEKSFFRSHRLVEDFGGLFSVRGGSQSFISFIDKGGDQKVLERSGYGFDFWVSQGGGCAYIIVFKPFDVKGSGVPERVKALFPGARVVTVELNGLLPEGGKRPGTAIAPDGKAFIFSSTEGLTGQKSTTLSYYDWSLKELWRETFYGDAAPQFVDGSRGFVIKSGNPVTRLSYYEAR